MTHLVQIGEKIYFAVEHGYAIYAISTVTETQRDCQIFSLDESFCHTIKIQHYKDKILVSVPNEKIISEKRSVNFYQYLKYKSVNNTLQQPIFLPKDCGVSQGIQNKR